MLALKHLWASMEWPYLYESSGYGKCAKILKTLFCTFLAQILLFMQLFPKIPSGMTNSVDPDQTAPAEAV